MEEKVAMSVCIQYSDYLAQTLPNNRPLFSAYYIITERSDTETIKLAQAYKCILLFTDQKNAKGASFNKSGMLHAAQHFVHKRHSYSWIVVVDADIFLPANLWKLIDVHGLNKNGIYGISRKTYNTHADYVAGRVSSEDVCELGVIGYFQLYWNKSKYYEPWSMNCSKCDMTFMKAFRHVRAFTSIYCFHFGEKNTNWDGRVYEKWGSP